MLKLKGIVIILFLQSMLYGCSTHVDDEVVDFVQEVKNRKSQAIEKLPPFRRPQIVKYKATEFRDPFEPFSAPKAEASPTQEKTPTPDLNRQREPLEFFPLDSLEMVGSLERDGNFFALIKDNTGIIHTAKVGEYIGQNSGKIERINESFMLIKELLGNGKGGYREHVSILPLRKKN